MKCYRFERNGEKQYVKRGERNSCNRGVFEYETHVYFYIYIIFREHEVISKILDYTL